jgi:hypothetical protein
VSLELLQVLYNAEFALLGINAAMLDLRNGLSVPPGSFNLDASLAGTKGRRRSIDRAQVREMTMRGKAASDIEGRLLGERISRAGRSQRVNWRSLQSTNFAADPIGAALARGDQNKQGHQISRLKIEKESGARSIAPRRPLDPQTYPRLPCHSEPGA